MALWLDELVSTNFLEIKRKGKGNAVSAVILRRHISLDSIGGNLLERICEELTVLD